MNKTMFAAVLSVGILLLGIVATTYNALPNAHAEKSRGHYLKDVGTHLKKRQPSKVCGDHLCTTLNDATIGLRKAQIDRGFPR